MKFINKLINRLDNLSSHVCVGLDSRYDKIPEFISKKYTISQSIFEFNKLIIGATAHIAIAYKSNVVFYAGFGQDGLAGLRLTNEYLLREYPEIPRLADCKRSEMDETITMVKQEIFDWLKFDCIMVTPWFGYDTVNGYLDDPSHGVIVYIHDSNKTAEEIQDVELKDGRRFYEYVAERVIKHWNKNSNIFVEAGATYPKQLRKVREIVGQDMPILTAGIGIQGGRIDDLKGVFGKNNKRLLVNSSRGIIFSSNKNTHDSYFQEVKKNAELFRKKLYRMSTT